MKPSDQQHWKRFAICWCVVALASLPFVKGGGWADVGLVAWTIIGFAIDAIVNTGDFDNSVVAVCAALLTTVTLGACAKSKKALMLAMIWFSLNIAFGYFLWSAYSHQ